MGYRALDIETVPDYRTSDPPAPTWKISGDGGTLHAVADRPFPPPHAHKVVAISWVEMASDDGRYYHADGFYSECDFSEGAEERLLREFSESQSEKRPTLVTWNGRCFDLPVLSFRSFALGVPFGWYFFERDIRYRYSESGHCDMMDVLSDYGASRATKLGDVARLIGLPGKTGPVSGASVEESVALAMNSTPAERVSVENDIAHYCLSDSLQTALIFLRHRLHRGMITKKEHNIAVDSFAEMFSDRHGIEWARLKLKEER